MAAPKPRAAQRAARLSRRTSVRQHPQVVGARVGRRPAPDARAMDRMKADQFRFAMAMESSRLGVWDWDVATGRVLYATYRGYAPGNPEAPGTGWPCWMEVDASEWMINTHSDDVAAMQPAVDAVLAGPAESFAIVYRRRGAETGRWEWIESQGKVVARGPSGRASRVVGTMSIATNRLREEAERRHLEQAFFQNIRRSTVAEVASGLSHEINQPLTAAMMHVQEAQRVLGRRSPASREVLRSLATAVSAIERAAAIAHRLRQPLKHPGSGWVRFDLQATARRVVELLMPDARAAGVAVDVRSPRPSQPVDGDLVQVEQVIANLVRNAIEAVAGAAADHRRVRVTVGRAGSVASVRVEDTGPGVAADVRDSLFLPYVTTKPDGTGLGLALSRTIAEAHGGRLVLEQGRRGRTVFLFEWPCRRASGRRTVEPRQEQM